MEQQIVELLLLSVYWCLLKLFKSSNMTAGRVPQTPYSFAGPKEYAEKGLTRRLACLARYRGNLNSELLIRQAWDRSPVLDEAL